MVPATSGGSGARRLRTRVPSVTAHFIGAERGEPSLHGAPWPAAVVCRASRPDERVVNGTLGDLAEKVRPLRLRRPALILVGRVLAAETFDDSTLHDATHHQLLRPRKKRRAAD